ncbi:hypothetical protein [Paucisalibacillus sp. EB02]|uniref:hypothetical protein n=1 Tax=Paucisalibacillus sp. EB02 TaxID=1347087 RepID=UPI0005A5F1BC|nr:hypothetical protein [Paucisalibacillus sp. EB02]
MAQFSLIGDNSKEGGQWIMDPIIYVLLTIAYVILFLLGIRTAMQHSWYSIGNILLIVILALTYDNGILALGKYIGEGELLRGLNEARYWLHALVTPLLILLAWHFLINANVQWAKRKLVLGLVLAFTLGLIIIEIITVTWDITLKPTWVYDVLSYKKVGDAYPIMIIGVSITLLITSILVWWKQKWPWYFTGVLLMGIVPMIHIFHTGALSNIGEFILIVALLTTRAYQGKRKNS